jgi:hypothetical protein
MNVEKHKMGQPSYFRVHLEFVDNCLTYYCYFCPILHAEKNITKVGNCLDIPNQGEIGVRVGYDEVSIACKTKTDGCLSFSIEGWKNLIKTEQDLHVGQHSYKNWCTTVRPSSLSWIINDLSAPEE